MEETLFTMSFGEWRTRTGGTIEEWRSRCVAMWDAIRTGPHYHAGQPCREVLGCKNKVVQAAR